MSDADERPPSADEASASEDALERTPDFDHLSLGARGGVAVLTLDRPDASNALHGEMLLEIGLALDLVDADASVRALVIHGAGRGFCAGADLAEFVDLSDAFAGREASLAGQDVANSLAALPVPTFAALHGFAVGGGFELALACDLRIAAPGTRLGLPETKLGLIPGYGGTQRLPRIVGAGRALDLILTGRMVDADEAQTMGLVSRIEEDALEAAVRLAEATLKNAPVALGLAKEAVSRGLDGTLPQGLEIEADLFGLAMTTDDSTEGVRSFLEKREADFEGH